MKILYSLFVNLLISAMKIGAVFNYKLKKGLAGRRQSCETIQEKFSATDHVIWMHAASLGEYEQGLPVLEKLKEHFPHHKILITFFSPSGYDVVIRKKNIADVICYLPFDKKQFIEDFTRHFKTDIFFTVKYEYWYHLLQILKKQNAKIYVVSALFYETQIFFKPYGKWFVRQLQHNVDWFFHQTAHSAAIAKQIGLKNANTSGDTRFDRVKKQSKQNTVLPFIADFKGDQKCIVFGSSWETEERLAELILASDKEVKLILAPHDLARVAHLQQIFPSAVLYSQLENGTVQNYSSQILIVDSIGLLSRLYAYATIAVVGGGFHSKGLHNILEAAVFGVPVFFGNHYTKNPEADGLIENGGGKSFEDEYFAAPYILELLTNDERLKTKSENARNYIYAQPDAAENILTKILQDQAV